MEVKRQIADKAPLMLIDIHVHVGRPGIARLPDKWRYPTPEEMIARLDREGIARAATLPGCSPECMGDFTTSDDALDVAARYPDRLIPFLNLDPRMLENSPRTDFREFMRVYKDAGCRGVGEYTANFAFDDPLQMNVFHQVEEIELPLTFHIAPAIGGEYGCYDEVGLPRLEKVLKECPRLIFLGHSQAFWAEISADVTDEARRGYPTGKVTPGRVVHLMREYPNLHGDLSAGSGYNAIGRDPEFGCCFLEEFQDRLYFGTDICRVNTETPIITFFRELREKRRISPEAWEKIAWKNACRLLRLKHFDLPA